MVTAPVIMLGPDSTRPAHENHQRTGAEAGRGSALQATRPPRRATRPPLLHQRVLRYAGPPTGGGRPDAAPTARKRAGSLAAQAPARSGPARAGTARRCAIARARRRAPGNAGAARPIHRP